jgi:alkanesulfonate monooxygenase SsuD/methylene tetrahydromethanopterin reductase-like flavin-dependent oxidoreductase (luciferase family)
MKFAVYAPNFGPYGDARALADLAQDAENAGWDGFFTWDHIAGGGRWPDRMVDPWVALAAVALQTSRIRIGALVTPIPRRRPWKLARETVSIDHLSGGRLIFAAGSGSGAAEFDHLGEQADPRVRGAMLDEGLDVLTGLWRGEPFSYEGAHYHVHDAVFLPPPVQQARRDGVVPNFGLQQADDLDRLRACVRTVRDLRASNAPFDVTFTGRPTPGDDPAQAAEIVAPYAAAGATWWLEMLTPVFYGGRWIDAVWPVEALRERIVQGPPPYP